MITTNLARALPLLLLSTGCGLLPPEPPKELPPERQIEIYMEMAQGFYAMGEYARAEDQALKGLDVEPDNRSLLLILGRVFLKSGEREKIGGAEEIFRGLLSNDDYRPWIGLGVALELKGQFYADAASGILSGERYTEAADLEKRAQDHREHAFAAWSEAGECFEKVLEMEPADRDAMNGLVRVNAHLGHDDEALTWARTLLGTIQTDLSFWRSQLRREEISAEDEARFRERERELVELAVTTRLAAYTLLVDLGRQDEALEELNMVLELDPEQTDVYSRRGELFYDLGQYERAVVDIDRFLRRSAQSYDSPDVQHAYEIKSACEAALAKQQQPPGR